MYEKREIPKIIKLKKGLFNKFDINPEILNFRREKCNACQYNSENNKDISLVDKVRKATISKPFCTLCKCFLKEKTASPLEMCGKYVIGEELEWNRIKIETMEGKNLNLELVEALVTSKLDMENGKFSVDLGKIKESHRARVRVGVNKGHKLDIIDLDTSCGCISTDKLARVDGSTYEFDIFVNSNVIPRYTQVNKTITINFKVDDVLKTEVISVKTYFE